METEMQPLDVRTTLSTMQERRRRGVAARKRVGRRQLAEWSEDLRDRDPLDVIAQQDQIRDPELFGLRRSRMAISPWNFYRGAAGVMAADLATQPDSGLDVQLCGDAHVLNFGLWATPERNLMFDLRDFDETFPGPFEWDLKRLATSLVVAARVDGIREKVALAAARAAADAYRLRMARYATMSELDIWYDGMHVDSLLSFFEPADRGRVSVHIETQQRHRTSRGAVEKLTTAAGGRPRITEDPPIRVAIDDAEQAALIDELLTEYRATLQADRRSLFDRFTVTDVVRQVVGVGSVGMRVYLVLLEGRSGTDPLFLKVKQAGPSVYESSARPRQFIHDGERVITGKRLVQSATDIFVGWGTLEGRHYYVRQFRDMKIVPKIELIGPSLVEFATACGETLARSHARTGDAASISAYMGRSPKFARSISSFAERYADQNDRDHARLVASLAEAAPAITAS